METDRQPGGCGGAEIPLLPPEELTRLRDEVRVRATEHIAPGVVVAADGATRVSDHDCIVAEVTVAG